MRFERVSTDRLHEIGSESDVHGHESGSVYSGQVQSMTTSAPASAAPAITNSDAAGTPAPLLLPEPELEPEPVELPVGPENETVGLGFPNGFDAVPVCWPSVLPGMMPEPVLCPPPPPTVDTPLGEIGVADAVLCAPLASAAKPTRALLEPLPASKTA
jgi:hypothetical protein